MYVTPQISIIIPTYNRSAKLSSCLQALTEQTYPHELFEVVIIDDGSSELPKTVIQKYKNILKVTLIKQSNAGPAAARNSGALNAKGNYLVFVDDDCTPAYDWLEVITGMVKRQSNCIIGGKIKSPVPSNIYSASSQLILDIVYDHYNYTHHQANFLSSCNMAVKRSIFLELGGFDSKFRISEDRDFCRRLLSKGYSMIYEQDAIVYHHDYVDSLASFINRYFSYGKGAYKFHDHSSLKSLGSFYFPIQRWLFYPFKFEKGIRPFFSMLLLIVWQISNIIGFCVEHINQYKIKA